MHVPIWYVYSCPNIHIYLNFQGCFTVQLSRFISFFKLFVTPEFSRFAVALFVVSCLRQRILSYQTQSHLSTLFSNFFCFFLPYFKTNENTRVLEGDFSPSFSSKIGLIVNFLSCDKVRIT